MLAGTISFIKLGVSNTEHAGSRVAVGWHCGGTVQLAAALRSLAGRCHPATRGAISQREEVMGSITLHNWELHDFTSHKDDEKGGK